VTVPVLGWLRSSEAIHESVNIRRPLALDPHSKDAAAFRDLARNLLASLRLEEPDALGAVEDASTQQAQSTRTATRRKTLI